MKTQEPSLLVASDAEVHLWEFINHLGETAMGLTFGKKECGLLCAPLYRTSSLASCLLWFSEYIVWTIRTFVNYIGVKVKYRTTLSYWFKNQLNSPASLFLRKLLLFPRSVLRRNLCPLLLTQPAVWFISLYFCSDILNLLCCVKALPLWILVQFKGEYYLVNCCPSPRLFYEYSLPHLCSTYWWFKGTKWNSCRDKLPQWYMVFTGVRFC